MGVGTEGDKGWREVGGERREERGRVQYVCTSELWLMDR